MNLNDIMSAFVELYECFCILFHSGYILNHNDYLNYNMVKFHLHIIKVKFSIMMMIA